MTLTPAATRIAVIATEYLADRGYDRCSLTEIAELAGIRKASLYSHFRNKDALFLALMERSVATEREFARECFATDNIVPAGGNYLSHLITRFTESADLRFLLRTAYAPPESIRSAVATAFELLGNDLRAAFRAGLPAQLGRAQTHTLEEAYLGTLDGVQVELLYGPPDNATKRRDALWTVLQAYAGPENP